MQKYDTHLCVLHSFSQVCVNFDPKYFTLTGEEEPQIGSLTTPFPHLITCLCIPQYLELIFLLVISDGVLFSLVSDCNYSMRWHVNISMSLLVLVHLFYM